MGQGRADYERGPTGRAKRGTWKAGVKCSVDGCDLDAKCKGMCMSHYGKQRWADGHRPPSANPESRRRAHIRHRYGIDPDDYDALRAEQGGVCAICKREQHGSPGHWKNILCVDHDHDTGRVRGLLCNDCNLMVGRGSTAERLRAGADYLDRG